MIFERVFFSMLTALALTIVLEAALAFLLGVRAWYGQGVVLLVNVITNPLLNAILTVVSFYISPAAYFWFLVPLEILIVFAEGRLFKSTLTLRQNPYLFSLVLNAGSYLLGSGILKLIDLLR